MAKPVTGLVVFGAATLDSTASLDSNYAALQTSLNDLNTYTNQLTDTSGAANAIVVTSGPNLTASLAFGLLLYIKIANTNTLTAVTINLNGLGARVVTNNNGGVVPIGSLVAGGVYAFIYDGTNFQIAGLTAASLLASNNTWSGTNTFIGQVGTSSAVTGASLGLSGNGGSLVVSGSGLALNEKLWDLTSGASGAGVGQGLIQLRAVNDAFSAARVAIEVDRSGVGITSIIFGNTTDKAPITLNGAVTIPAPGTTVPALTITTLAGSNPGVVINDGNLATTGASTLSLVRAAGSTANNVGEGANLTVGDSAAGTFTQVLHAGGQTEFWQFNGAWLQIMRFTAGRAIQGLGPVAAGPVDMTPDSSTFTGTVTGVTAGTDYSCTWYRIGKIAMLVIVGAARTSNSTSFTMTGLPAAIQPASAVPRSSVDPFVMFDNGVSNTPSEFSVSGGTVTFWKGGLTTGWTNGAQKGIAAGSSIVLFYPLF